MSYHNHRSYILCLTSERDKIKPGYSGRISKDGLTIILDKSYVIDPSSLTIPRIPIGINAEEFPNWPSFSHEEILTFKAKEVFLTELIR